MFVPVGVRPLVYGGKSETSDGESGRLLRGRCPSAKELPDGRRGSTGIGAPRWRAAGARWKGEENKERKAGVRRVRS